MRDGNAIREEMLNDMKILGVRHEITKAPTIAYLLDVISDLCARVENLEQTIPKGDK
jgi:hypothetical protein